MKSYHVWAHVERDRYIYHGFFKESELSGIMALILADRKSVVVELAR